MSTIKLANLDFLFRDLIPMYSNLLTIKPQPKDMFLGNIKKVYSMNTPQNHLFYISCEKSNFDTIRLSDNRNSILFNH